MKTISGVLFFLLVCCTPIAWAQRRPTIGQSLDHRVSIAEEEIVSAADAMPEEKYSFAPTAGEFNGVRTFAEQVKHLSAANYQLAARVLGEQPLHGERDEAAPDSVKSKAEIMEYVKGSFAELHRAAAAINEKNMREPIRFPSRARQTTRVELVVDAVAHCYDHYGQMVEYLRMNGIVPPASRR